MKAWRLPLAALLMAAALAGCTTPTEGPALAVTPGAAPPGAAAPPTDLTAAEAIAAARERALQWRPDAEAIGAFAQDGAALPRSDGGPPFADPRGDMPFALPTDPVVGDGRAAAWGTLWGSAGASEVLGILAGPQGILDARTAAPPEELARPLGTFTIDSERAAALAQGEASFAAALDRPGAGVLYVLAANLDRDGERPFPAAGFGDGPAWMLIGIPEAGAEGADAPETASLEEALARIPPMVLVDARTGATMDLREVLAGFFAAFAGGMAGMGEPPGASA